jgi:hypothetical protein
VCKPGVGASMLRSKGKSSVPTAFRAEHGTRADAQKRPLRSRFRARLTAGVRPYRRAATYVTRSSKGVNPQTRRAGSRRSRAGHEHEGSAAIRPDDPAEHTGESK